jgi:hypothetical protein
MSKIFKARPSKIYKKWYFGFENKPSGNPAPERWYGGMDLRPPRGETVL